MGSRYIKKAEEILASWYKRAPHLSKKARTWTLENMWWVAIVTVVLLVSGTFLLIPLMFTALALTPTVNIATPMIPYSENVLGLTWVGLAVFVVSFVATAVMVSMAVIHLRDKQKRGWDMVFAAYIVFVMLNLIATLLMSNAWILLNVAVNALLGGYWIFEIRDDVLHIHQHHVVRKKA